MTPQRSRALMAAGRRLGDRLRTFAFAAATRFRPTLPKNIATWAKPTSMRAMNIHVRPMNNKTAVVLFEWEIATPGKEGGAPSVARGNNLFVAVDDKGWTIVAGQVARARTQ